MPGDYSYTKTYVKTCRPGHFMRKYNGFGISNSIIDGLLKSGVEIVKIIYIGKQGTKIFYATVEQYATSSLYECNPLIPRDVQRFVSIKDMLTKERFGR